MNLIIKSNLANLKNLKLELKENQPEYIKKRTKYKSVYGNLEYYIELENCEKISELKICINEKEEKYFMVDSSKLVFTENKRIFNNYYGYVYLTIKFKKDNREYILYTEWLDVYVKKNETSEDIKNMVKYIYDNSSELLYEKESNVLNYASTSKSKNKNIYTKIALFEKILLIYKENFKFFKRYTHYVNIEKKVIDDFEKLSKIKGDTIQFITMNPQYLKPIDFKTGIKYNKTNLIPMKTLINKNEVSNNIYENNIILGFLKSLYIKINDEINLISKVDLADEDINKQEYISSGYYIHKFVWENIDLYLKKLTDLKKQFLELYILYKKVLKCNESIINKTPKPTNNFIKFKHYQKIYLVIKEWFDNGNYNLEIENMILSFNNISKIYEYYILLNLKQFLIYNNFKLKNSLRFEYSKNNRKLYKDTEHKNIFIFSKENIDVSIFYQPFISIKERSLDSGLGLFRNNCINYEGEYSDYYAPDYVVKINKNNKNYYLILDAKFSTKNTILKYSFSKLAYKYVFSISTENKNDEIIKIYIINGQKNGDEKLLYNAYNSNFLSRNEEITPEMKILTFNTEVDLRDNYKGLFNLFDVLNN